MRRAHRKYFIFLLAGLLFLLLVVPLFRRLTGTSYLHIPEPALNGAS